MFGDGLISAIILVIAVLLEVFYLMTLSKILDKVRPQFRMMPPGQVWLNLIPAVNLVTRFIMVNAVSGSLVKEFEAQGIYAEDKLAWRNIGFAYCILLILALLPHPILRLLASLLGIIFWIVYWVKISECSKLLKPIYPSSGDVLDSDELVDTL